MLLSLTGARWLERPANPERVEALAASLGLNEVVARCLAVRNAHPPQGWLSPSLDHLHDPFQMAGMTQAVARLRQAAQRGQRVRIITDYDVDGTTSSLILQAAMRLLDPAIRLDYHIPNRFVEGYGFSPQAAQQAVSDGVDLIITADIGVRDHAAVGVARAGGVDVIVCDHHLPPGASVPPDAIVLCPPQAACSYPNPHLAACGVSFKVAQALHAQHPKWRAISLSLLKLAAIGTVADMVPLTTLENRAIVQIGLQQLNRGPHHAGLQALLDVSGAELGSIRESTLGFRIGPRINAAGRVAEATLVVELLSCRDPARAQQLAQQIDGHNRQRQELQRQVEREALAMLSDPPDPFVVVARSEAEGWHRGVVGIVASRLKDQVQRPVAVVAIQGDHAVGSVRSVPGVHAVHALDSVSDLLERYGGHPAAAGFTVPTAQLDALRSRLGDYVLSQVDTATLVAEHSIDITVLPAQLSLDTLHELERLGPFGQGNRRPRLLLRAVNVRGVRVLGKTGSLLKFVVPGSGSADVEAVWWGQAEHAEALGQGPVDVLASLGQNTWRGRTSLQLEVVDVRPSA